NTGPQGTQISCVSASIRFGSAGSSASEAGTRPQRTAGLSTQKCEIGRRPSFPDRLRLVARARPALIGHTPVFGRSGTPYERVVLPARQQRPVDIGVDVGCEAEYPALLQHPCETIQIGFVDETALPVPLLRPRVGKIGRASGRERAWREVVSGPGPAS